MIRQSNQKFLTGLYEIAERVIELEKAGKKIIKFNIGDPDQDTPKELIAVASKALKEGKTKYGSAVGDKKLREKIGQIYQIKPERVIISPGSKWAIFSIIYLLLKKGDNIILPSPHWTAYEKIAERMGIKIKFLKTKLESNWEINLEELENLIDKKTRLIILNNPNNPTSKVINEKIVEGIVEMANKNKIKILSDETYWERY
jgi:aspartate aminotransferase